MIRIDGVSIGSSRRVPTIRQAEHAECGLACLAMVANFHGLKINLNGLRRRFSISAKGATLKSLVEAAGALDIGARALRLEPAALEKLALPAVLHWNLNHFVVLVAMRRRRGARRYVIHDPAVGAIELGEEEVSAAFTGVALELIPTAVFRKGDERVRMSWRELYTPVPGMLSGAGQVVALSCVLQIAALFAPLFMQLAIDMVLPASDRDLLVVLGLVFAGVSVVSLVSAWLRNIILLRLSTALGYQMVARLFHHLLHLPLSWFGKRHVADVVSRFTSTQPVVDALTRGLLTALVDGVLAVTTLAVMLIYSPALTLPAIAAVVALIAIQYFVMTRSRRATEAQLNAYSVEHSAFMETVRGIASIKAFGQEAVRQTHWRDRKIEALDGTIRVARLRLTSESITTFALNLEGVVFTYLAISLVLSTTMSLGMVFAFVAYKQQFTGAASRLLQELLNFNLLDVHFERIADIAGSEPERHELAAGAPAITINGAIGLRGLRFAYGFNEPDVLRDINAEIAAGETVVIAGPSGGGKTTLMKVMLGLLKPGAGQILIDGVPLDDLGMANFRRQVASVAQDDMLYSGSLMQNITFFDPHADMGWAMECARLAMIHDEISRMPMRYESLVGDMGSSLSGGQKQRVLLARALYRRPRILFIDEGTAHLDVATERAVNESIQGLGMTRVMVAHRPETIRAAQRVLYLVDGELRETTPGMML